MKFLIRLSEMFWSFLQIFFLHLEAHALFYFEIRWEEVEKESGYQLVYKPGSLSLADTPDGIAVLEKYAAKMAEAGIPFERFNSKQLMERYPQVGSR